MELKLLICVAKQISCCKDINGVVTHRPCPVQSSQVLYHTMRPGHHTAATTTLSVCGHNRDSGGGGSERARERTRPGWVVFVVVVAPQSQHEIRRPMVKTNRFFAPKPSLMESSHRSSALGCLPEIYVDCVRPGPQLCNNHSRHNTTLSQ